MVALKSFVISSAAILATFATVEAAIAPTYPQPGTIQTQGTPYDITWTYDGKDSQVTYQIDFMTGSNDNQTVLANVAKNVQASALKYSYAPPAVDPNAAIYFFMFTGSDGSYYWTTRFGVITPGGNLTAEPEKTQPNGDAIPWGSGKLASNTTAVVATAAVESSSASASCVDASASSDASSDAIVSSAAQIVNVVPVSAGSVLKPVLGLVSAGAAAYFAL